MSLPFITAAITTISLPLQGYCRTYTLMSPEFLNEVVCVIYTSLVCIQLLLHSLRL
jgi:hypothetical protein